MKNRRMFRIGTAAVILGILTGCVGISQSESWNVTCPWAPSGVAARVSQRLAEKTQDVPEELVLHAQAITGDNETVNAWVAQTKPTDHELVLVGEGLLSITPVIAPEKVRFDLKDFTYVENLYSSVFVLSADAKLGLNDMAELQAYVEKGYEISVAVNGATNAEAFLAAALFGAMGAEEQLRIVPYQSAAEAARAVTNGETRFAVSHQTQILDTYQQDGVTVVCAFAEAALENGPFAGVEGVGEYGYPYFHNHCFIMAPAGADAQKIMALQAHYRSLLADQEIVDWMQDTLLLTIEPMEEEAVWTHIKNVKHIVRTYRHLVSE